VIEHQQIASVPRTWDDVFDKLTMSGRSS